METRESSQEDITIAVEGLALWITKENSSMNFLLQASIVGYTLLNIQLFLVDQMLHDIRMMISIKKGICIPSLICLKICNMGLLKSQLTASML